MFKKIHFWDRRQGVMKQSRRESKQRIYLTGPIQFARLAFQDDFCNSISDSLVMLSAHEVLIHRGNFFTLDAMEVQNITLRYSESKCSEVKVSLGMTRPLGELLQGTTSELRSLSEVSGQTPPHGHD